MGSIPIVSTTKRQEQVVPVRRDELSDERIHADAAVRLRDAFLEPQKARLVQELRREELDQLVA